MEGGAHLVGDGGGAAGGAVDEDVDEPAFGRGIRVGFDVEGDVVLYAGAAEGFEAEVGFDCLGEGDGGEIAAVGFDAEADDGAGVDVEAGVGD